MTDKKPPGRDRRLSIPADFDKALRAALNVKPPEKSKRQARERKPSPKRPKKGDAAA